jgi:hypothetical protein
VEPVLVGHQATVALAFHHLSQGLRLVERAVAAVEPVKAAVVLERPLTVVVQVEAMALLTQAVAVAALLLEGLLLVLTAAQA